MTNKELVAKAKEIALDYKTLYVLGGFGVPATPANKKRWISAYSYNAGYSRRKLIEAASADTFFFDCIGLIKAILWGWDGDKNAQYGGAKYASKGVPDVGADYTITICKNVSSDFRNICLGEAVWMDGHIGVYIGDGLAVECSPRWKDGVQITAVGNIGKKSGYNTRTWTKHGKLPWVTYIAEAKPAKKTVEEVARDVIAGKYGSGTERKKRLKAEGYDPAVIQAKVNELLNPKKSVDEIAREVIAGKWGSGLTRKSKLKKAGYDPAVIQKRVNELLKGGK